MSTNRHRTPKSTGLWIVMALAAAFPVATPAAPGTLAQAPLVLSVGVLPNIFFVLDDSGSMDFEVLKSAGANTAHPQALPPLPPPNPNFLDSGYLNYPALQLDDVLEHCAGYNVMAYDPNVTYTPWKGTDSEGNAYGNRALTNACTNPYDPSSCTVNLTTRFYFRWNDNGDGEYQNGECPKPDPVNYGGSIDAADCATMPSDCIMAANATARPGVIGPTNFANWYSYYRKREYVMKRVVSEVIDASDARMGLATLHNTGTPSPSTPIAPMFEPNDPTNRTNKELLLHRLFSVDSQVVFSDDSEVDGTPLRRALDQAGTYFNDTDGKGHEFLTGASCPILDEGGECQRNFTNLVSDGAWTDESPAATGNRGNADGDRTSDWDRGAQEDAWRNTLADIAMHYYESDLSRLENKVIARTTGDDVPNKQQHMTTFTVAPRVLGSLHGDPPNRTDAFSWPDPFQSDAAKVDDMRHAAWNSRGQFLSAKRPQDVISVVETTTATIVAKEKVTASAVGFNRPLRPEDPLLLLQPRFNSDDWSGDLLALSVDPESGVVGEELWSAAEQLDSANPSDRVILTRGETDGVAFEWDNLPSNQKQDLCVSDDDCTNVEETLGQLRLDFLRGDRGCEEPGGCATGVDIDGNGTNDDLKLRERGSRLGDIVGSGPLVVGAPALNWPTAFDPPSGTTYAAFKESNVDRTPVAYVGANDGMLHGFLMSTGQEVLAYVPSSLASRAANNGLHYLTEPAYVHRFYVDRTPAISDVYIPTTDGGSDHAWRTVAVGGLGAGGRGVYALDITHPEDFSVDNAANIVMWEFTDLELGYTLSQPIIAMMNNGRWAAIFGSGYNDTGSNEAHLFIVFLEGGIDGTWTSGTDFITIEAKLGTGATPLAERNGLSSPAVADLDGNGTADRIYVGDLLGNLWAFDIAGAAPSNWLSANASIRPLFTATDDPDQPRPITIKPEISKHPSQADAVGVDGNQPNVMVYFGTGQYLTEGDRFTTGTQAFYGVWDRGVFGRTADDLQKQTFEPGFEEQVLTDKTVDWTKQYGWYLDLDVVPGERIVVDTRLRAGIVFFNSLLPAGVMPDAKPCDDDGSSGFLYAVDLENGGPPDAPVYDLDGDGVVNSIKDIVTGVSNESKKVPSRASFTRIPTASTFMGNVQYTGSTEGDGVEQRTVAEVPTFTGRRSWQQLYRD